MATILSQILTNMTVVKRGVVDLKMCLSVINIVEIGDDVSFFVTLLQFIHKINPIHGCTMVVMANKLVICNI